MIYHIKHLIGALVLCCTTGLASDLQAQCLASLTCFDNPIELNFEQTPTIENGGPDTGNPIVGTPIIYRFSNVANGIDALVTFNGGINGGFGVGNSFVQGFLDERFDFAGDGNPNEGWGLSFDIVFVNAGTTTPTAPFDFYIGIADLDSSAASYYDTSSDYIEVSQNYAAHMVNNPTNITLIANISNSNNGNVDRFQGAKNGINLTNNDPLGVVYFAFCDENTFSFTFGGEGNEPGVTSNNIRGGNILGTIPNNTIFTNQNCLITCQSGYDKPILFIH